MRCKDTDWASAGLVQDLKARGMSDDTLVVWSSEFGRRRFVRSDITNATAHGRNHHQRAFIIWLTGSGVKRFYHRGASAAPSYHASENPVHFRDLQASHSCNSPT
jgi:arylsulfatase A-like enzyme